VKNAGFAMRKKIKAFNVVNVIILVVLSFLMLYPILYVFSLSISNDMEIINGRVLLFPRGFDAEVYKLVFKAYNLGTAYKNTIVYTVLGTFFSLILACLAAYPLAHPKLYGKKIITFTLMLPMFVIPGVIPKFLVVARLGMIDSIWAVVLPMAFSAWNIIILRTGMKSIPLSLIESAYMDGAGDFRILFQIIIPLSKATIDVITLFSAILYWNDFLAPLLYLNRNELFPLQIVVRKIVLQSSITLPEVNRMISALDIQHLSPGPGFAVKMKMATVILSMGPILVLYPFLQRYFVKGVMIGSVKG